MNKLNNTPVFSFVLGLLWSITLLVQILESGFVFNISYIPMALGAIFFYGDAIRLTIKYKSLKEKDYEKDS